jgi:hypothetical protein
MNDERCTHCGDDTGLIEDDWRVWHCLDRAACLDRLSARLAATRTMLGDATRRASELAERLDVAERRCEGLERVCTASSSALSEAADRLEAEWYLHRGEVVVRRRQP